MVNNHSEDYEFCESYLRNVGGEYQYLVKNKNGEAISGVLIDFTFYHKYFHQAGEAKLRTDSDGVVTLGMLKNIREFQAVPCLSRVVASKPKFWVLPDNYSLSYPEGKTISLTEKETLKIPFKHKELKQTNFSIWRVTSDGSRIVENMYPNTKLVKNKGS